MVHYGIVLVWLLALSHLSHMQLCPLVLPHQVNCTACNMETSTLTLKHTVNAQGCVFLLSDLCCHYSCRKRLATSPGMYTYYGVHHVAV